MTGERLCDGVTLYEGDCLDVLPTFADGSFDAVVTDPPYGTGGYTSTSAGVGRMRKFNRIKHGWDQWSTVWLAQAARVGSSRVAVFSPDTQLDSARAALAELCGSVRLLVWCKPDPMPTQDARIGYGTEFIVSGGGLQPVGGGNWFVASTPRATRDHEHVGHPYQKPLALMRWLVRALCPPGGNILDPFAGSGTTAVAAIQEGRTAVLVERDPTHCATIRRRVAHAAGVGSLFEGST